MAHAEEIEFDVKTIEARGLSGQIADYFKREKRFSPGAGIVTLAVNGVDIGTAEVLFNSEGQPCIDKPFLERAGLKIPVSMAEGQCLGDLRQAYPQAIVRLVPGRERIELIVPPDALGGPDSTAAAGYSKGGWGGVFNYDVLGVQSGGAAGSSSLLQGMTDLGFNAGDWVVRSRQSFSSNSNGTSTLDHQYAYAQRSFAQQKQVAQAGELYVNNSLFAAPQIIGVQAFPEEALRRNLGAGASATGIARTQARVEVRQAGALIYSTLMPPGPFTLNQLPILTPSADLQVSVIEQDGETRSFTVPFSSFSGTFVPREKGWSAALGRIRSQAGPGLDADWLGTFSGVMPMGGRANLAGGLMLSEKYRALGGGVDGQLPWKILGSAKALLADDARSGTRGLQFTGTLSAPLARRLSASLSTVQQTPGYRDLTNAPIAATSMQPGSGMTGPAPATSPTTHDTAASTPPASAMATTRWAVSAQAMREPRRLPGRPRSG
nr:fimbria/pilus outer membrane usher protein [Cupriavidus lacunae]